MDERYREMITWNAIGMRDAADRILEQVNTPHPDLFEINAQAQRGERAMNTTSTLVAFLLDMDSYEWEE